MKKTLAGLLLLTILGGCKKPLAPDDTEATRQHSREAHQSLDKESSR